MTRPPITTQDEWLDFVEASVEDVLSKAKRTRNALPEKDLTQAREILALFETQPELGLRAAQGKFIGEDQSKTAMLSCMLALIEVIVHEGSVTFQGRTFVDPLKRTEVPHEQ